MHNDHDKWSKIKIKCNKSTKKYNISRETTTITKKHNYMSWRIKS